MILKDGIRPFFTIPVPSVDGSCQAIREGRPSREV